MPRFWFQRTSRKFVKMLSEELEAGRLRQGWGYLPEQDLRTIRAAKKPLSDHQKACWRGNRRMLPNEPDGVKPGDYIITPNLPSVGRWSIVRVTGGYRYEIHPDVCDFGHILKVELINRPMPINPRSAAVGAALRRTAKARNRMWNVDHLANEVLTLVDAVRRGDDVSRPEDTNDKLGGIRKIAVTAIEKELRSKFQGGEFEKPVKTLLERIYGEGNVETHAGPKEHGADFICSSTDGLGIEHKLAVQVKMWHGTADWQEPLNQIRRAYENHEDIGAGVVLTMARDFSEDFKKSKELLAKDLSIPIRLLNKNDDVDLFMKQLPDLVPE